MYVADAGNHLIRKISPSGLVSTLAGFVYKGSGFANPTGVAVDASGNVYVADAGYSFIRIITPSGGGYSIYSDIYSMSPTLLPAGLSFDATTGTISGTPTAVSASTTYTVTASNTAGSSTVAFNLAVNAALSTDATLANLSPSAGSLSPAFASGTTSYTSSVGNSVSSMTLTPTVSQANATVKVNGISVPSGSASQTISLNIGNNTINTLVTAQDGITTQTYTLKIVRLTDVNELKITNLLTPNGDGLNDYWEIEAINAYPNNSVTIFDAHGRVVFTQKAYQNTWDGNSTGHSLVSGTYFYVVDFGDGSSKVRKGYVTIIK